MRDITKDIKREKIEGKVNRILMHDRSKGFAIVSLKSSGVPDYAIDESYPDSFVALGSFGNVTEGQFFKLQGKWTKHPRYGWRFSMDSFEEVIPTDKEGLIDYLSSGLFKGIGPVTAIRIVEKFGEDSLNIIEKNPLKLVKIKGISKKKALEIGEYYIENNYLEELMIFLKPYGVTNNQIVKIYQQYQTEAIDKLKLNPYKMCDDIHGFGFKIADNIARAFGISFDSEFRIEAGIIHSLKDAATNGGHVFLKEEDLLYKTGELLESYEGVVGVSKINKTLKSMKDKKIVILDKSKDCDISFDVYLPLYYYSERSLAKKLRNLVEIKPKKFDTDANSIIKELESAYKIEYADKQKEAIYKMEDNNLMVITGGPGVGKTTIIKAIIEVFERNCEFAITKLIAPTGRAAKKMEESTGIMAKTIHRELEYKKIGDRFEFLRDENHPISADLLIIDESTMIDLILFSKLVEAIGENTKVIFVGDPDQLPSVGAGNVFSDLIDSGQIPLVRLNEIFRQDDTSRIVINANLINRGDSYLDLGDDFEFIWEDNEEKLVEIIEAEYLKEVRKSKGTDKVQILTPFRTRTSTGANNLNKVIQEAINPKGARGELEIYYGEKTYRVGDKVMQTKNDYDEFIFNGDIGYIRNIYKKDLGEIVALIEFDKRNIEYQINEFENIDLAYALTVHKSQGSEYETVIMPMTTQHYIMLKRNLIYTGVTRAKEKLIMIGSQRALELGIKNNEVKLRNSNLKNRI